MALVAGCPDDSASNDTEDASSTGTPDESSSGGSLSTTVDPDTTATVADESSSTDPSDTTAVPEQCGDGGIDGDEECDGLELIGRSCESEGFPGGVLSCTADCQLDTSACLPAVCGDGEIHGDEECDGEELVGESCEGLGFDEGDLGCTDTCTFDTSACIDYSCGNDLVEGREVCDGAGLDGEDCLTQGFDGGELGCAADCGTFDVSGCYTCGDGGIDPGEACEGDVGDATCIGLGFEGGTLGCSACQYDVSECFGCGNGEVDGTDVCDGSDFGGQTCAAMGFESGSPTCAADCSSISFVSCLGEHVFCSETDVAIGPGVATATSPITVDGLAGSVVDVDVLVDGTHTQVGDLAMSVRWVESNIDVVLADSQCGAADNFDATFDMDASAAPACGVPAFSGSVLPQGDLTAWADTDGSGNGTWELDIADEVAGNGGTLDRWCLTVTTASPAGSFVSIRTTDNVLVAIDPVTLEFADLAPLDIQLQFADLAFDPVTDNVYLYDGFLAPTELYTLDITTGETELVGISNASNFFGMVRNTGNGSMYAVTWTEPLGVYTVDVATAEATLVGIPELPGDALAYDSLRDELISIVGGGGTLWRVDPDTGASTVLADEGFINNCGLAYEPVGDRIWAIDLNGDLYQYDPNAGYARTLMLSTLIGYDGLAFVPGLSVD